MGIRIDTRRALAQLERDVAEFRKDQLPFAASLALNAVAAHVRDAELEGFKTTFDKPTNFTLNAFSIQPARKARLIATVLIKPRQAAYLEPFMDDGSGRQVLGSKNHILMPIKQAVNQYGNIPRNKLQSLKGRSDVFIGPVTFKNGKTIYGVWQRGARGRRQDGSWGNIGAISKVGGSLTSLTLLIEFEDPKPVKQRLHYRARAAITVDKTMARELKTAFAKAIATAR